MNLASEKWKDIKLLAIIYNNRILLKTFRGDTLMP